MGNFQKKLSDLLRIDENKDDDYIRYPIKDGEEPLFENMSYDTMLRVHKETIDFWEQKHNEFMERHFILKSR